MINEIKKMPRLRFKEFSGEWQAKKLGELFNNTGGTTLENKVIAGGTHKFISIGNYSVDGKYIDNKQRINLDDKTRSKLLNKNNLVMVLNDKTASGDLIGSTILISNDDEYIYNQRSERLVCDSSVLPKYAWFFLNSKQFRKEIFSISQGGTQIYVNFPSVKKLKIFLPTISEQEKIAEFLTSVDEHIELQDKKVKFLQKYKKGIMQKIFSQQIRFKDENGKSYPDWQENKLDEVLVKNSNKNKGALHKLVQSVSNISGFINQTDLFKDHVIASKDLSNYYVITKGSFAYNPSRIDVGSLAYKTDSNISVVSPLYVCFNANNTKLLDIYLLNWFNTADFKKQMQNSFEGSVRNTLSYDSLKKMKILIPIIQEQQRIAEFFTSVDNKIELEKNRLKQAKQFKKALLQRMFV